MDISKKVRFAQRFLHSLWSYALEGEPHPFSASYAITNRCNLRCSYCNYPYLSPAELSLEEIELLLKNLKELGVMRLGIVGGEPLLYRKLGAVLERAKSLGFYLTLNTNLTLYSRRQEELAPVDLFFTSLDGPQAIHERNRGPRSFAGVCEAIADLRQRGKTVIPICVVTEANLPHLEELLSLAEELGVRIHFQPYCSGAEITRGEPERGLSQRFREAFAFLLERKRKGALIASSTRYLAYLSQWEDFSRSALYDPRARCAAGYAFLYVDHRGEAYPCPYLKGKVRGISLLAPQGVKGLVLDLPCTRCAVGPMVEFNLLYQGPHRSLLDLYRGYGGFGLM